MNPFLVSRLAGGKWSNHGTELSAAPPLVPGVGVWNRVTGIPGNRHRIPLSCEQERHRHRGQGIPQWADGGKHCPRTGTEYKSSGVRSDRHWRLGHQRQHPKWMVSDGPEDHLGRARAWSRFPDRPSSCEKLRARGPVGHLTGTDIDRGRLTSRFRCRQVRQRLRASVGRANRRQLEWETFW